MHHIRGKPGRAVWSGCVYYKNKHYRSCGPPKINSIGCRFIHKQHSLYLEYMMSFWVFHHYRYPSTPHEMTCRFKLTDIFMRKVAQRTWRKRTAKILVSAGSFWAAWMRSMLFEQVKLFLFSFMNWTFSHLMYSVPRSFRCGLFSGWCLEKQSQN